jgi:hypothetical protein
MKKNELETCVRIYDDTVSKEWCKETVNLFEKHKKEALDIKSSFKSFTELNLEGKDEWNDVKKTFLTTCQQYFVKFMKDVNIEKHHMPLLIDTEQVYLKKYEANDKDIFKNHCDVIQTGPTSKRFLVFIMYLSDVEEGGETNLPRQNITSKPKAGRLLMFPPYWTHPHQGEKVIKGTKYILMTYLHLGEYIAPYRADAPIQPLDLT